MNRDPDQPDSPEEAPKLSIMERVFPKKDTRRGMPLPGYFSPLLKPNETTDGGEAGRSAASRDEGR